VTGATAGDAGGGASGPPLRIVLATANPDKAAEIAAILAAAAPGLELVPRPAEVDEVEETGDTLADNARLKAAALVAATGLPALADDTGLLVDALDGAPGVHSARWAGPGATSADNVELLLRKLEGVPDGRRTARFATVAVLRWPDGRELVRDGLVEGTITASPRGDRGFGYDPVFAPDEGGGATFAEMEPQAKHALSHRGRAFRALAQALAEAST
jgi:XTP/dITP diphosphohydrolase